MNAKSTETKIREDVATSMAERMTEYAAMGAVTLRKAAAELGVKGASRGRKADLLTKIHLLLLPHVESDIREYYAKEEQAQKFTDGTRVITPDHGPGTVEGDPVMMPGGYVVTVAWDSEEARSISPSGRANYKVADLKLAPKTTKAANLCADCGQRPIDQKTAGRDSTLCTECFDYAGWENQHSDDAHDSYGDDKANAFPDCPVCAEDAKPGTSIVDMIQHKKARWFAEQAKAAGWKISYEFDGHTGESTVTAVRNSATIKLVWEGRLYIAKRSEFKDAKGARQLRNASAAVKAVAVAS